MDEIFNHQVKKTFLIKRIDKIDLLKRPLDSLINPIYLYIWLAKLKQHYIQTYKIQHILASFMSS